MLSSGAANPINPPAVLLSPTLTEPVAKDCVTPVLKPANPPAKLLSSVVTEPVAYERVINPPNPNPTSPPAVLLLPLLTVPVAYDCSMVRRSNRYASGSSSFALPSPAAIRR